MPTTGANLASEIIAHVLDRLSYDFPQRHELYENAWTKEGLASCSQTCHCWAAQLQPVLFRTLHLCDDEDVTQLLSFLCRKPELAKSIQRIYFNVSPHSHTLQIHRLSKFLTSGTKISFKYGHITKFNYELGCSVGSNTPQHRLLCDIKPRCAQAWYMSHELRSSKSAHQGVWPWISSSALPRTLPTSIAPITNITLSRVRLASRVDLIRALCRLTMLRECYLEELRFHASFESERPIMRLQSHRRLQLTNATATARDRLLAENLELLSSLFYAAKVHLLSPNIWDIVSSVINKVVPGWEHNPTHTIDLDFKDIIQTKFAAGTYN